MKKQPSNRLLLASCYDSETEEMNIYKVQKENVERAKKRKNSANGMALLYVYGQSHGHFR